jgi:hypothetical protein
MEDTSADTTLLLEEPTLDDVKPEDKNLVLDVISLLSVMQHPKKLCKDWTVKALSNRYEVTACIDTKTPGGEWEVFFDDLNAIYSLDPPRINVSIKCVGQAATVKVLVLARSERCMKTEIDVIRVRKRTRWFGFL